MIRNNLIIENGSFPKNILPLGKSTIAKNNPASGELVIAIYMRLSKTDALQEESHSISAQRELLEAYVGSHFENYRLLEFQDDGFTGTNYERPGFSAMLRQVSQSALNCIIVKDFSRFFRDHIEMDTFLNHAFPFMGIRFISVGDHYDSAECTGEAGDLIYFKNLLNDFYSKDLSAKVKASLAARKEKGQYISANPPFGYEKPQGNKHMLIIKKEEATIIRRIFQMTQAGNTSVEIARCFNREGVKTPLQFKGEKRTPKGGRFTWHSATICQILTNEMYVGDVVYGKFYKEHVGGKNRLRPREEWKVFPNHHEPIIDREVFAQVQLGRGKKRPAATLEKHPLTGKVVCGCCGRNLQIRKEPNPYFRCPNRYANPQEACVAKVNAMFLEQYALFEIQNRMQEMAALDRLLEEERTGLERELQEQQDRKREIQANQASLPKERVSSYERFVEEIRTPNGDRSLAASMYKAGIREITKKEDRLRLLYEDVEREISHLTVELGKRKRQSVLQPFSGLSELTHTVVGELIKRIVVYDERHVEIFWQETMDTFTISSKRGCLKVP